MDKITRSLYMPAETWAKLDKLAKQDNRSTNQYIELLLIKYLKDK